MARDYVKQEVEEVKGAVEVEVKDRAVECVFVSDGVYKYVYSDTKEDVV